MCVDEIQAFIAIQIIIRHLRRKVELACELINTEVDVLYFIQCFLWQTILFYILSDRKDTKKI